MWQLNRGNSACRVWPSFQLDRNRFESKHISTPFPTEKHSQNHFEQNGKNFKQKEKFQTKRKKFKSKFRLPQKKMVRSTATSRFLFHQNKSPFVQAHATSTDERNMSGKKGKQMLYRICASIIYTLIDTVSELKWNTIYYYVNCAYAHTFTIHIHICVCGSAVIALWSVVRVCDLLRCILCRFDLIQQCNISCMQQFYRLATQRASHARKTSFLSIVRRSQHFTQLFFFFS